VTPDNSNSNGNNNNSGRSDEEDSPLQSPSRDVGESKAALSAGSASPLPSRSLLAPLFATATATASRGEGESKSTSGAADGVVTQQVAANGSRHTVRKTPRPLQPLRGSYTYPSFQAPPRALSGLSPTPAKTQAQAKALAVAMADMSDVSAWNGGRGVGPMPQGFHFETVSAPVTPSHAFFAKRKQAYYASSSLRSTPAKSLVRGRPSSFFDIPALQQHIERREEGLRDSNLPHSPLVIPTSQSHQQLVVRHRQAVLAAHEAATALRGLSTESDDGKQDCDTTTEANMSGIVLQMPKVCCCANVECRSLLTTRLLFAFSDV